MVDGVRRRLNLTSLQYQRLDDLVEAVGLPKERLCTYCWDGADPYGMASEACAGAAQARRAGA